ncbi:hypothetical protein GCM10009733_061940 [Nonomuraea maheshkhaliensis]|uniref:HTH gntR-type domain-containing protein n=2 Tax=Nonomuraea maheshkhaliensis TaxID=419590 RepID=A0ABN2FPS0_9ACTN
MTLGASHQTLRDEVTAELRRRILTGELAQGERLVEDRLAAALGVSRNPVRESIRVLAAEGFIQVVPRIGATVARLSAEEGEELFDVRMAVEGLAARLAARKRGLALAAGLDSASGLDCASGLGSASSLDSASGSGPTSTPSSRSGSRSGSRSRSGPTSGSRPGADPGPDTSTRLRQVLDQAKEAVESGRLEEVADLNTAFHLAVGEAAGNSYLALMMKPMLQRAQWIFSQTAAVRAPHSWQEHLSLFEAIEAGDEDEAQARAVAHVAAARRSFLASTRAPKPAND